MNERNSNYDNRDEHDTQARQSASQSNDITAAMTRFEKAVQDLVAATAGHLGDRATGLIDETSKRLEAELRLKRVTGDPRAEGGRRRRHRRHRRRHRMSYRTERRSRQRSGRLAVDHGNKKIAGVCGGLARNFGFESWAVRLGALTGLIFLPQIVFPAYWITYFIMDKSNEHEADDMDERPRKKSRRRRRRSERYAGTTTGSGAQAASEDEAEEFIPRQTLRDTTTDLTQAELRLRRLESFVTSDQYELQKELALIEGTTDNSEGPQSAG